MTEWGRAVLDLFPAFGGWALLAAVVAFVAFFPEKAERIAGWLISLFRWTGRTVRKRGIVATLQGKVSDFARSIDREAKGAMPYNLKLQFVAELDRAELDPESSTVIVRIKDRGDSDKNLVHAMLAFAPAACVPAVRPYLRPAMSQGLDVAITHRMLASGRQYTALQYLPDVLAAAGRNSSDTVSYATSLLALDAQGLLTRVVLAELRDYGALIHHQRPSSNHREEAAAFLAYLDKVAEREPGKDIPERGYRGRYIATAFVLVGRVETMLDSGATNYVEYMRSLRDAGYQRAYIAARSRSAPDAPESLSMQMASRVAEIAAQQDLGVTERTMRFKAADYKGDLRPHVLIDFALGHPL